jgi:hypothetical protein
MNTDNQNTPEWNEKARVLLRKLMTRAYMRIDYHEADEIADLLGLQRPTDHEHYDIKQNSKTG